MKRILCGALVALMIFSGFSCGSPSKGQSQATVWSALSTEKFRQDETVDNKAEAKLDFVGMKGETQSLQIMITAHEYIKGYSLETADLVGGDVVFSKNNIMVYAERYVDIYLPFMNAANRGKTIISESGFYPDALVPIESFKKTREDRIEKGNNQGIWIDVEIPRDAAAGKYAGTFNLYLGEQNKKYEIPVSLEIYDLTLPEEVHSKTNIDIWYEKISKGEGENYDVNTDEVYYEYLLTKRVNASTVPPKYTASIDKFMEFIAKAAKNPAISTYTIPLKFISGDWQYKITSTSKNGDNSPETVLKAKETLKSGLVNILTKILDKNLELRAAGDDEIDLFKKAMFYFEDEPVAGWRTQRVKVFCEQLKKAKDEIANSYQTQLEQYPDLAQSLKNVNEICPSNQVNENLFVSTKDDGTPDYEKSDGLTLWCPEEYKWKDASFRETVKQRQAYGEEFWWYTCVINSPSMSYYVESLPIGIRSYSWMQYQYDIKGVLYWQTVAWDVPGYDPYEDVISGSYGGGEGILLYPGAKYGQKQPISSIRLQQLFAGQQDYEYFYMLDGYLKANNIEKTAAEIIYKLNHNKIYDASYTLETADPYVLEANRIKILNILNAFAKNNVTEAKNLVNSIFS